MAGSSRSSAGLRVPGARGAAHQGRGGHGCSEVSHLLERDGTAASGPRWTPPAWERCRWQGTVSVRRGGSAGLRQSKLSARMFRAPEILAPSPTRCVLKCRPWPVFCLIRRIKRGCLWVIILHSSLYALGSPPERITSHEPPSWFRETQRPNGCKTCAGRELPWGTCAVSHHPERTWGPPRLWPLQGALKVMSLPGSGTPSSQLGRKPAREGSVICRPSARAAARSLWLVTLPAPREPRAGLRGAGGRPGPSRAGSEASGDGETRLPHKEGARAGRTGSRGARPRGLLPRSPAAGDPPLPSWFLRECRWSHHLLGDIC